MRWNFIEQLQNSKTAYCRIFIASFLSGYVATLILATKNFSNWLYTWQTFATGILALLAACLTVYFINQQTVKNIAAIEKQIEDSRKQYEETRERKSLALRACMSDALVELSAFTKQCFEYVLDDYNYLPSFKNEAINVFKDSIEYVDTETAKTLSTMVSFYQIHNSRLREYCDKKKLGGFPDNNQEIYDVIKLNRYFINLFAYARNEVDSIPVTQPTENDMIESLRNIFGINKSYAESEKFKPLEDHVKYMHP